MSERLLKLNDLLREEISKILQKESWLDGIFVTVMGASISPTLEHATIYISVIPISKSKIALQQIIKKIFFIQQKLNKRLVMRPVPKIRFQIDTTEMEASRIEKLLQNDKK